MPKFLHCLVLIAFLAAASAQTDGQRQAFAVLTPRDPQSTSNIVGTIMFSEASDGLHITGGITGLPAGTYGFHVHEGGNIYTCDHSGAHFNPYNTNHGGIDHAVRHVGDLGNVVFAGPGEAIADVNIVDTILTLRGHNSVLGRTLVLHEQEDDLGLGGHETSLTTGNAGARVACGVIGIMSPIAPWNSATTTSPPLLLFITAALFAYLRSKTPSF